MLDKEVLKPSKVNNWGFVSHKAAVFQDLKTPPSLGVWFGSGPCHAFVPGQRRQGLGPCQIPLNSRVSHTIKYKSHVVCETRMEELTSPEEVWIVNRGFSCAGEHGVMHYISLPSTHSPPLSWSLKDIAYKRDDSRRRPSSVVLLHLGATAACLWRDKVVPFSFCILRPIF